MKRVIRGLGAAAATAVLAGGLLVALPGAASANDYGYTCKNWKNTSHSWSADCHVTRGKARTVTECANGKTHYGKWVGRGYWKFTGECGVYALMATDVQWKK
ncbi:hypothetical protein ACFU5O_29390 [Streptomyces sp. NPDC057445]|uniref:hypothetical protein n=1 Tax=Streptomyces sp. NPDC057445 TaxID=3346136 RepID=UPI0036AD39E2